MAELSEYFNMNQRTASSCTVVLLNGMLVKTFMKGRIIAYASHKKKLREMKEVTLRNRLKYLSSQFAISSKPDLYRERQEFKYELKYILSVKTQYALTCLCQLHWESGERPGFFLAYHIRQQKHMNNIPLIKVVKNTASAEINSQL